MGDSVIVVLGGSRHLEFIPGEVAQKLDDLITQDSDFFVGDAPGSDRAFQKYLFSKKYSAVRIFSSADEVRNNLGNWPSEKIDSGLKSKSSAVHAFKDRHMTANADIGIMVWDGESAGTLSNVIDLLDAGKECYLYLGIEQEFFKVDNKVSLAKLLTKYPDALAEANKRLDTFRNRQNKRAADSESLATLF
jgi:hypothetical protein